MNERVSVISIESVLPKGVPWQKHSEDLLPISMSMATVLVLTQYLLGLGKRQVNIQGDLCVYENK